VKEAAMKEERKKGVLYFVTSNNSKYSDFYWYVNRYEPAVKLEQVKLELDELKTSDHRKIAVDKACQAWNSVKKPLVIDDSGLYFARYSNFPGPFLKHVYYGLGLHGLLKLLEEDNRVTFVWYIVFAYGEGLYEVFEGRCEGVIISPDHLDIVASNSLKFSDIFIPTDLDRSPFRERSNTDYQYRALRKFFKWYHDKNNKSSTINSYKQKGE